MPSLTTVTVQMAIAAGLMFTSFFLFWALFVKPPKKR